MSTNGPITLPTIITGWMVEDAIEATLKPRLEFYAPQLGYQKPRSYPRVTEFDRWPEDQIPAIIIVCGGLGEAPVMRGDKRWMARWAVAVVAMVSARTETETRRMAQNYGALIRATILQESSLHGFSSGISWMDESLTNLQTIDRRTLLCCEELFLVDVENVVDGRELPKIDGWPYHPTGLEVLTHEEDVQLVPLDEEVTP